MGNCLSVKTSEKYQNQALNNNTTVGVNQELPTENKQHNEAAVVHQDEEKRDVEIYDYRAIHSLCRWNKKPIEEIRKLIPDSRAANLQDPDNGNFPIHIASQNGHLAIVDLLIERGCLVNAVNKKGNTAFHMALSYDYYECCLSLLKANADLNVENTSGFPAKYGIDGNKSLPLLQLMASKTTNELLDALQKIKLNPEGINQSSFAGTGLKTKKELKSEWNEEVQTLFKEILNTLTD